MWSSNLRYALLNICVINIFKFVTCKREASKIWSRICPFYLVWSFNVPTGNFGDLIDFFSPLVVYFFWFFFSFFTCVKFQPARTKLENSHLTFSPLSHVWNYNL
jgi:hypothetical protein